MKGAKVLIVGNGMQQIGKNSIAVIVSANLSTVALDGQMIDMHQSKAFLREAKEPMPQFPKSDENPMKSFLEQRYKKPNC